MKSSLVIVQGNSKVNDEDAFEFAELAGVKFIKLRHEKGAAPSKQSIRGFQGVYVRVIETREGGRKYLSEPTRSSDGNDIRALRPMIFNPEGRTQLLTAYLPDLPYNREKLAKNYFGRSMCLIVDPQIHAEVKERAQKIVESKPKGPSKDEVINTQADENALLRKALDDQKKENEDLKKINDVIKESKKIVKELPENVRASIREIVHTENETFINKLKEQSPNRWESTKKYKDTVLPIILERENTELERINANNSGVSQ